MGKENGFVPIDEANTERIRFDVDLPSFVERTNVRANTERLEGWMRLGGISHLRVETFEGERQSALPTVIGFDSQGNAYAGKTSVSTADMYLHESRAVNEDGKDPKREAVIKIDIAQADDTSSGSNLRSSDYWAKKINEGISRKVREVGTRVLINDNLKYDLTNKSFLFWGMQGGFVGMNGLSNGEVIYLAAYPAGVNIGANALIRLFKKNRERRISVFFGPQLDRAALLQARTRLQPVVRGFEEKK